MSNKPFLCPCGRPSFGSIDIKSKDQKNVGLYLHYNFCEQHLYRAEDLISEQLFHEINLERVKAK